MKFFTIGYGGRHPDQFVEALLAAGVKTVVDIRLRPDRASMGAYVKAKTPDKGIEKLLGKHGIAYRSLPELGNLFLDFTDWADRYQDLLGRAGGLLAERLDDSVPAPWCLLCAERNVDECHRKHVAEYVVKARGWTVEHL